MQANWVIAIIIACFAAVALSFWALMEHGLKGLRLRNREQRTRNDPEAVPPRRPATPNPAVPGPRRPTTPNRVVAAA
jgi:hypothetical protein